MRSLSLKSVLALAILFIFSSGASAVVWESNKEWNDEWQERYSNWIATSVGPNFFKELGSPFKQIKLDCADAHYALIAYFSRAHGLNMKVNNASFSNLTDRFDRITDSNKRLAAFINYLSGSYGTESLAHKDTIPVGIKNVMPGDLFTYKISNNGEFIRHAYIVKNINIDGTFDILYSTQARRDAGQPLKRREVYMFKKAPFNKGVDKNHWGFRRAKKSFLAHVSQEEIAESDFSQYDLAFKLLKKHGVAKGRLEFFRQVRIMNQKVKESPNNLAKRNFNGVCGSVQDRIKAVADGVKHNEKLGGKCMAYGDYDAYSTPSRDSGIMDDYSNYFADVNAVDISNLNDFNKKNFVTIFKKGDLSESDKAVLVGSCPVKTSIGTLNLGSFKKDLFALKVSFHPNDNIYRRWGFDKGSKTRCEQFYGYPD